LTEPEAVNTRWNEYFDKLYNDPNEVDEAVLVALPSSRNTEEIPGIEEDEVVAAITRMKNGKVPGIDNVAVKKTESKRRRSESYTQIVSKNLGNRGNARRMEAVNYYAYSQETRQT